MKIASVVVNRNDGYKDFERGLIYFKSALESFDEVNYIDWNSPSSSFLWEIEDKLPKTGKIKHFIIPPEICNKLIPNPIAHQCNESLELISNLDENTFYTISRREAPKDIVYKYNHNDIKGLRKALSHIPERHFPAKVTARDEYSLINCCGDFQIAHKSVWEKIRGFEENMIFQCFVDTNAQKKAVLNGCGLEVLYNPPLYHMEHGAYYTKEDGTRVADLENEGAYKGDQKAYNDVYKWVEFFQTTFNKDSWGLSDISIEYETL
jgi:hypothetical protein